MLGAWHTGSAERHLCGHRGYTVHNGLPERGGQPQGVGLRGCATHGRILGRFKEWPKPLSPLVGPQRSRSVSSVRTQRPCLSLGSFREKNRACQRDDESGCGGEETSNVLLFEQEVFLYSQDCVKKFGFMKAKKDIQDSKRSPNAPQPQCVNIGIISCPYGWHSNFSTLCIPSVVAAGWQVRATGKNNGEGETPLSA